MSGKNEKVMSVEEFLISWEAPSMGKKDMEKDLKSMLRHARADGMRDAADMALQSRCTMANLYGQIRERVAAIEEGRL
jgi:hypothetical protein